MSQLIQTAHSSGIKPVILLSLLLLFTSCFWQDQENQTREDTRNLKNSTATFVYNMIPGDPAATITPAYSTAVNTFAVRLLGEIYKEEAVHGKNVVVSPFSVSRNLAVITEASHGTTRTQLFDVLGGQAALDDATSALAQLLYADQSIILQCADALWFDSTNTSIMPAFKLMANRKYGVEAAGLDFEDVAGSVASINKWVSANTSGKITSAIEEKHVSKEVRAILTSAIYFEADWTSPFDVNETRPHPFAAPGGSVMVDMMSSSYRHATYKNNEYENVKIYYGKDKRDFFYLDVYMPLTMTLDQFIAEKCSTALGKRDSVDYEPLKMPRFFFENNHDLKPVLQNLGIVNAFDADKSEVTGMVTSNASGDTLQLYLSYCFQKAGIKTNEEGTVAYAVTVTGLAGKSSAEMPGVILDKPFVYFIRAGENGLVLFAGVVNNPNEKQ